MSKSKSKSRPNILLFVVDEQRFPPTYESAELRLWKERNLKFQTELAAKATVFHNHYANTTACCPSRGTLHTGQYPSVHGVTQTDGVAIGPNDPEMTWMPKFTVPTTGNYMEEIGYTSTIKGKWHISNANIYTNSGSVVYTFDNEGVPIPELEKFYLQQDVLSDYGYHGWIGPEPHGPLPLDSGASVPPPQRGRDIGFSNQLVEELEVLNRSEKPWFLNATFVNPHDIAVFGLYSNLPGQNDNWDFPVDPTLPEKLFTPEFDLTHSESLETKPLAQTCYRDDYDRFIQPIPDFLMDKYLRCYYTLQKIVDQDMDRVWEKLKRLPCYKNTIILFTSDHGELLASHGNMHQKWYNAYQESIHVPFMISSPLFGNKHRDVHALTSHIDIAPTILGFTGVKHIDKIRRRLSQRFSLALPFPGKDLSKQIRRYTEIESQPIYFFTEDQPDNGPHQQTLLCLPYRHVPQPCNVDAIMIQIENKLWKLTRYYNKLGHCENELPCASVLRVITGELYNLTQDPIEIHNLVLDPAYSELLARLNHLLIAKSFLYRGVRGTPVDMVIV